MKDKASHREEYHYQTTTANAKRRGDLPTLLGILLSGDCFVVIHSKPGFFILGFSQ